MQKSFLLFLLCLVGLNIFAQKNLPTIKATSTTVDIRVGDDYFVKGGWVLDASKNPDIFSIGSKWLYETKKVSFITDIDSISFDVKPSSTYDFMILLNEKEPCYIQIVTLGNPIFMNPTILISVLLGLIIVFILAYLNWDKFSTERLLYFGFAAPILFWLMTFLSGAIHGNYNHFKNVISELGAIGTKSEIVTSLLLIVLAVICTFFSIGFYRASKKFRLSTIPAILSFGMPITMIWASIFSLGNEFHSLTGPLPFLIILGCLLSYLLWRRNKGFLEL
ncbi:MAG: DUF998 domain-containing protein, partial [Saprospiraceae bacterium]|nr:DUF998 domain-containing protein [Saprospiraceae bacterium]